MLVLSFCPSSSQATKLLLCIFFPLKEKKKLQKKILTLGFQSIETETEKGTPASVEEPGAQILEWELSLTYLKFAKRKTFNVKLRKFREEDQIEQKFPMIVQIFRYTAHGCPAIEENEAGEWY